jgi:hypothetical protein
MKGKKVITKCIRPKSFHAENHYYPKVHNSHLHPMVYYFMHMNKNAIIQRYCHLHPTVEPKILEKILKYKPSHMHWAGGDLFCVATEAGNRKVVLIETNSSPSGQKSMPLLEENQELGGYNRLIEQSFLPLLSQKNLPKGALAVLYDKNEMEASGYAAALAECTKEQVYLVPCFEKEKDTLHWKNGVLYIKNGKSSRGNKNKDSKNKKSEKEEIPIRAAIRYVTQKPWDRIPIQTKTLLYNPIIACLAGGRNKLVASKAYELLNAELSGSGLKILTPYTIRDVKKEEIPLWIKRFQGHAVIKVPYLNAGLGVFIVTNKKELEKFMAKDFPYNKFIVQSLIGNFTWSSHAPAGKFFHIGTMPNNKGDIFVADFRLMVMSTADGLKPVAIYCRRAKKPLRKELRTGENSWDILGTNLSSRTKTGEWMSDSTRLMLMDRKDFNKIGLGLDELIEGYIQTVLAVLAIDKMAKNLLAKDGSFKKRLFASINADKKLCDEIQT